VCDSRVAVNATVARSARMARPRPGRIQPRSRFLAPEIKLVTCFQPGAVVSLGLGNSIGLANSVCVAPAPKVGQNPPQRAHPPGAPAHRLSERAAAWAISRLFAWAWSIRVAVRIAELRPPSARQTGALAGAFCSNAPARHRCQCRGGVWWRICRPGPRWAAREQSLRIHDGPPFRPRKRSPGPAAHQI